MGPAISEEGLPKLGGVHAAQYHPCRQIASSSDRMFKDLRLGGAFILRMLALSVASACVEAASSSEEASVVTRTAQTIPSCQRASPILRARGQYDFVTCIAYSHKRLALEDGLLVPLGD